MKTIKSSSRPAFPAPSLGDSMAFTLVELLVTICLIVILIGFMGFIPPAGGVRVKGLLTKDLSNAKQIALGLRLYAQDHNGAYPAADPTGAPLTASNGANGAFANLVPDYIPQEKIFFVSKSAWHARNGVIQPPDEVTSSGTNWSSKGPGSLSVGENNYAYVSGLTDASNPHFPLVADGFRADQPGTYDQSQSNRGGVWKGKSAIVIRVDGSGAVEKCNASFQVYGETSDSKSANIFTSTKSWIPSSQVFNPL